MAKRQTVAEIRQVRSDDPYRQRCLLQADPVLRDVQLAMLRAARQVLDAKEGLEMALERLKRHPDYEKTQRAWRRVSKGGSWAKDLDALSLAWWLHRSIESTLKDAPLADSVDELFAESDPRHVARVLARFVESIRAESTRRRAA